MENKVLIIQNAMTLLEGQVQKSSLASEAKSALLVSVREIDAKFVVSLCEIASPPLTKGNLAYILCFLAGIEVKVIARVFNVEPATVYTARFRLRRHFVKLDMSPF